MYTEKYISLERSSWAQLYPLGLSDPRTTEGAKERQSRNFFVVNFFILSAIIVSRPLEIGWSRSWIDRINSFWDIIYRNMSFTILCFLNIYIHYIFFAVLRNAEWTPHTLAGIIFRLIISQKRLILQFGTLTNQFLKVDLL